MNSAIKIYAEQDKIGDETKEKYSDEFFEVLVLFFILDKNNSNVVIKDLDVVVNALDNVAARLYVDSRCVTNQQPLLESGTLGTKVSIHYYSIHLNDLLSFSAQRVMCK